MDFRHKWHFCKLSVSCIYHFDFIPNPLLGFHNKFSFPFCVWIKTHTLQYLKKFFAISFVCYFLVIWLPDAAKVIERVISLFQVESKVAGETSKSQRIADLWHLTNSLPECLFIGCGSADQFQKFHIIIILFPVWVFNGLANFWVWYSIFGYLCPCYYLEWQRGSLTSGNILFPIYYINVLSICVTLFFHWLHLSQS